MKARKSLCALFMVMLLVLSSLQGIASAAGSDVETVSAGFGEGMEQHVTVNGDVEVNYKTNAVFVEAHAPEDAEDKSASVVVNGNVTFSSEGSASAVYVEGHNGNASAEISGDLSATSNGSINGVETWGHSYNGNGEASVTIGGSVTAESRSSNATGIDSDTGSVHVTEDVTAKGVSSAYGVESYNDNDITIGGNVNAEAETPTGIYAYSSTQSNVDAKGSVSATGKHATGLQLFSFEGTTLTYIEGQGYVESKLSGDLSVTVENGILATSTSTETNGGDSANGISFYNDGGKLAADIIGDVVVKSASGDATGVLTDHSGNETGNSFGNGTSEILVHGNVISNGVGIALDTFGENTDVNVLVENEIQAKKVGVAINRTWFADEESETEPKLTVWKIKLNDKGKIVEWGNSDFDYVSGDEAEQYKANTIADFEKNIMYIAKVEQPGKGGTIKVVDKDGKDLQKSYDFDIAHEGDKLYVNVDTERNYEVVNIYNGLDKTVPLLTDEDGKYYIVVPKGGGIYISAELKFVTDELTITADDASKEYDGTALTKDSYKVSGLADGDSIKSVTISGSQTLVGSSNNVPSAAVIKNAAGEDVTASYDITYENGSLEVTKKALTITADSASKEYDGTALTKNSYTNTALVIGDTIESVTITGSQSATGKSDNVPSAAVIKNAAGEDVSSCYDITYLNGSLEVTKKALTITADSASKEYDKTELTKDSYTVSGLADGDTIKSVTIAGSQIMKGSSENVPSKAVIVNAKGEDVTSSYEITYKNGTLTVTAPDAPSLDDDQKPAPKKDLKEDGKEQILVLDPANLPDGYTIEYSTDGGKTWKPIPTGKESGEYTIEVFYKADENHTDFFGDTLNVIIQGVYNQTESDGDWTKGSGKTYTFRIKKAFNDEVTYDNLTGVFVDGKKAESGKDYTPAKGSAIITFAADYLETLSVGEHKIRVTFKDGETSVVLKILAAIATPAPAVDATPTTGDTSMPILWATLILLSMAGASVVVMRRRKRV